MKLIKIVEYEKHILTNEQLCLGSLFEDKVVFLENIEFSDRHKNSHVNAMNAID